MIISDFKIVAETEKYVYATIKVLGHTSYGDAYRRIQPIFSPLPEPKIVWPPWYYADTGRRFVHAAGQKISTLYWLWRETIEEEKRSIAATADLNKALGKRL